MSQPRTQWLIFAIASGGCAALNGAFAKLTTTQLTTAWATNISNVLGMDNQSLAVDYVVRGFFFLMNLAFNGVMWGLFTRALTLSTSTVRVSVINTSANFVITALLGALVFSEELPGLWWAGACLLVAGSVIIGRRDETSTDESVTKGKDDPARPVEGRTTSSDKPVAKASSRQRTNRSSKKRSQH